MGVCRSRFMIMVVALAAILALTAGCARGGGKTVATVNGEDITEEQFVTALKEMAGRRTLDYLIEEKLIQQAAAREGLVADDKEVEGRITELKELYGDPESFREALMQNGMTEESLRRQLRASVLLEQLAVRGVEVTDEEISAFFEAHKDEFGQPEQIKARHILLGTEAEARQVRQQLLAGADFAALAREKSLDEASKKRGGDLGYFKRGDMVAPFEEAAFALREGEVSEPVKSVYGYHIIEVVDRKEARPASLEDSRDQVRQRLLESKARPYSEVLGELRQDADIKIVWPR